MNRNSKFEIRNSELKQNISHSAFRIPRSQGFTLLEVLLAMAILAVIMTVVYASFSNAGRNVEQAEAMRDETDTARALLNRLSADIANAYIKAGSVPVIFYGKKEEMNGESGPNGEKIRHDSINLTTLTNWPKPDSKEMDLWEVGYFFKENADGNGYTLYRREKRDLTQDGPLEGGDEYEITGHVKSLQLTYTSDGINFNDNGWDSRTLNNIPKAVEIALMMDSGKLYVTRVDTGRQ